MAGLLDELLMRMQGGQGGGLLGLQQVQQSMTPDAPPQQSPMDDWFQNSMNPGGRLMPRDFDQMVVPPYTLPPDQNTFDPNYIMDHYFRRNQFGAGA
jgi:hypothetical protein